MRNRLLLIVGFLMFFTPASFAQIVGTNVFLQGAYLEIGEDNMGALGTCTSPGTYHAHCAPCIGGAGALAEVYDWGHDGWTVGTPPDMGDYTQPGTPFEGWTMEISGTVYDNWVYGDCSSGDFNMPGSITGYTNAGGSATGTWTGAIRGINIIAESRVDTLASAVVFTVRFYNTTLAAIPNVYYERTCDPDNASTWSGGSTTNNVIVHQNEDAAHDVLVSATADNPSSPTGTFVGNALYTYMGLGTKDCRAVCTYFGEHGFFGAGLAPGYNPDAMWSQSPTTEYTYALGDSDFFDCGIALIYNIGTLNSVGTPGDSAVISFAYFFNHNTGLDSAFPDPQLVVEDSLLPNALYPARSFDTFNVCAHPGDDTVIVDILHATTGNWTWSKWTWAPSTGLTSTTGTVDTIISSALPASITYTITGTDSSGTGTMLNCQARVFYLTILACNSCTNNSPCQGDSLLLFRKGDSTGCTYLWSGPAGFTSTMQDPFIYPSTLSNTGEYYVIRTLLGVHDTDSTNVIIHPLPILTVSSNAPLCTGIIDTLLLSVTPLTTGETFSWTGPDGFTSDLEFPTVPGFLPVNVGVYKVVATTPYGCTDSGTVDALLVPPPPGPPITGVTAYCYGATFVPFVAPGSDVMWYPHDTSTIGSPTPPVVNTSAPGLYTYYATQQFGSCISPKDSITVRVYTRIVPDFNFTITRGCSSDRVDFLNTTANSISYTWNFGDGATATDSTPALLAHSHTYAAQGDYNVVITGFNAVCSGDTTIPVDTRHFITPAFTPVPDTFCVNYNAPVFNNASTATVYVPAGTAVPGVITNSLWNFGDGSPVSTDMSPSTHIYTAPGTFHVTLVVTDSISCLDTLTENVYVLQIGIRSVNDTTLCLSQPLPLYNAITLTPNINLSDYNYVWTQSAPNLSDTSVQVPFLSGFGDFVDTLTVTLPGILPDGCPARDTITVHSILGAPIISITPSQTIPYGSSIDLASGGQVYYTWYPNDGSLNNNNINNPVATPLITTTYTVFGLDGNGCLDSASVTITVDSAMQEGFPGAFTPNGDGKNDVLHPVGLKYQKLVEFRIYNRWGQMVFYSNDINKGWDGTFNGVPQDIGVYGYELIVGKPGGGGEGSDVVYKGTVTLLR